MDTSSHICMGVATGLMITNVATNNNIDVNTASVVAISVIANVFPDIDVLFKIRGNDAYINNHRGMSHSFLFAILWIAIITLSGYFSVQQNFYIYLFTATLGVSLHLFTDLLNGYGVQILWPIHKKWIAFGITYTFDAVFISAHLVAFALIFIFNLPTLPILFAAYALIISYVVVSFFYHLHLKKLLINKYGKYKRLILQAKATPLNWKYVYETSDKRFYMGIINKRNIIQLREERRQESVTKEIEIQLAKNNDLQAFLNFTPIFNYKITHKSENAMEIKFYDLRYLMVRKNHQYYTFNCIIDVEENIVIKSYLGFTVNEENAIKKFKKLNN